MDEVLAAPVGAVLIFFLRIADVSLATLRLLFAVRGRKWLASGIGFFEILIWIYAVGTALQHLSSPWHVIGYAGGFAAGTFVGLTLEERLALGVAVVRVTSTHGGVELAEALRALGFGVTETSGYGRDGVVEILHTVVRRRDLKKVFETVEQWDPDAFVTVEEPKAIHRGWLFSRRRK